MTRMASAFIRQNRSNASCPVVNALNDIRADRAEATCHKVYFGAPLALSLSSRMFSELSVCAIFLGALLPGHVLWTVLATKVS